MQVHIHVYIHIHVCISISTLTINFCWTDDEKNDTFIQRTILKIRFCFKVINEKYSRVIKERVERHIKINVSFASYFPYRSTASSNTLKLKYAEVSENLFMKVDAETARTVRAQANLFSASRYYSSCIDKYIYIYTSDKNRQSMLILLMDSRTEVCEKVFGNVENPFLIVNIPVERNHSKNNARSSSVTKSRKIRR